MARFAFSMHIWFVVCFGEGVTEFEILKLNNIIDTCQAVCSFQLIFAYSVNYVCAAICIANYFQIPNKPFKLCECTLVLCWFKYFTLI